jgi:two-component system, OmpR family, phosphate regulon sensor histidine kinase PhoR
LRERLVRKNQDLTPDMRTSFRTKVFVASVVAAAVSLIALAALLSWQVRSQQRSAIERRLADEARLVADLLSQAPAIDGRALDAEADRLGQLVSARITFVAEDGRVVGDSTQPAETLDSLENHALRPEVVAAREQGFGTSQRHSTTVDTDMLYVAVRASHPVVRYVRLALPLADVDDEQLAAIRRAALTAMAVAIPLALIVAWVLSAPLARRVQAIASVAARYSAGDLSRSTYDYGTDELGTVARALDTSVQELGGRLEELSRDRARMGAILAGMVEGVLVVDRQGRLQLVNRAAQEMLRVDASATSRSYLEVIRHPDIASQLTRALGGEDAGRQEVALTRDPGRTFIARAAPVSGSGGGGAVLVLHDITDLRRADQIRRDFVANVSHELRTPLTAIRGYVEALLDDPADPDGTRRFLEIIARHTTRMERLVKDLLRLARLDARQEALEMARCDVRQIFTGVIADLSPSIEAKQQRVAIAVQQDALQVDGDPAKLHDIVRNLVENAVNYSPDGADVTLAASRQNGKYTITVADSGPGIPPEDLGRVFERFYRVDKSRARPGGTGLGLAIVKHLVELHGGEARAENAATGGAVFTVTLPATEGV